MKLAGFNSVRRVDSDLKNGSSFLSATLLVAVVTGRFPSIFLVQYWRCVMYLLVLVELAALPLAATDSWLGSACFDFVNILLNGKCDEYETELFHIISYSMS